MFSHDAARRDRPNAAHFSSLRAHQHALSRSHATCLETRRSARPRRAHESLGEPQWGDYLKQEHSEEHGSLTSKSAVLEAESGLHSGALGCLRLSLEDLPPPGLETEHRGERECSFGEINTTNHTRHVFLARPTTLRRKTQYKRLDFGETHTRFQGLLDGVPVCWGVLSLFL